MKTFKTTLIPTLLLLAGSALAQGQMGQADIKRRSADMMIPPAIAESMLGGTPAASAQAVPNRMSDDDRRAQERIRNTDMMRPQGINSDTGGSTAASAPVPEDDRRMAEIIRRTDQMKPN